MDTQTHTAPSHQGRAGGESSLLEARGVKPTSTRILVYRALAEQHHPMSLRELDDVLDTVDRSTIFRTLTLLLAHQVIHAIEDGSGMTKYETCEGHNECSFDDQHTHFYCTCCHRTFCFHHLHVPVLPMPEGFAAQTINYIVKGICPNCKVGAPHDHR